MRHSRSVRILFSLLFLIVILSNSPIASGKTVTGDKSHLEISVSIPPMAWIVEGLLKGSDFEINVVLPPGKSPATYDPTPKEIATLQEANIYFMIGLPFEKALINKNIPNLPIRDCTRGIELRLIEGGHDHGDKGEHFDPHVWLDPVNVKIIADDMMASFAKLALASDNRVIADNYDSVKARLDTLNNQIAKIIDPYRGDTIFVFHPAFGYFTDRYGLYQVAIEKEGHEPSGKHLADLVDQVKKSGARAIFVQPEFSDKAARAIADELKIKIVYLDPLVRDYPNNMLKIAQAIADAMKAKY